MSIVEKIQDLKAHLGSCPTWEDRYREIIQMGKKLPPLEDQFKIEKFQVKGCQSQVWLYPEFREGKVFFHADSDAMLVKGIVALLVQVYSGETPKEILSLKPDFLSELGISEHLSMNRTNGLAAMAKQIHLYAYAYSLMG